MKISIAKNVFSKVSGFLKSPWTILYVLLSLAIFISLGYYVYYYYVQPQIKPSYVENNELVKEEKVNDESDQRLRCAFKIYDNEKKFLNTRNLELQEHVMNLYNNY